MPLSKKRNKDRMRLARACVQPSRTEVVQPNVVIPGLIMDGNKIVGVQSKPAAVQPTEAQSTIPLYDPLVHKAGDRVMVKPQYGRSKKLIEVTIPELDADGNAMPTL